MARKRRLCFQNDGSDATGFWKSIGYEVIGPLYVSFVCWVAKRASELKLEKLFFLARDGYHLIQVFDLLRERWNLAIDSHYLYSSRRLLNVPRIRFVDEEALAFLTTPNPSMSLKHFFDRIGLDPTLYANRIQGFGFTSFDQLLTTKDGVFISPQMHHNMRELMRSLTGDILKVAADERSRLLSYLDDAEMPSGRSAIVDIGWQASSIKSLQDLLATNGSNPRLQGLYFSTWRFAQEAVNAGCLIDSFFVHLDRPGHRAQLILESVELLESFFCAPYPTIVGLEKTNGCWEPIYGDKEVDDAQQQYLSLATEAAFEFVGEALDLMPGPDSIQPPFAYLEAVLERILRHPKSYEAEILGQLSLRNTFGGHGPIRYVAKLPAPGNRNKPEALRETYDYCYWKKGFLAQLTSKEKEHLQL